MMAREADPIRSEGLDVPLLTLHDKPHQVVLGSRRLGALKARMRPGDRIPVLVAGRSGDVMAWCQADLAVQGWRGPGMEWTWGQMARVYLTIGRVIKPRPARDPSLVKALGDYFGVHELQLRNAGYLLRDFDSATGDRRRRYAAALEEVNAGILMPQTAIRRVQARVGWHPDADRPPPAVTAERQAQMLGALASQLSGLLLGIEQMGTVHPDLTAEQRNELYPPLAKFRRALTRLTRQLNTQGGQDGQEQQD